MAVEIDGGEERIRQALAQGETIEASVSSYRAGGTALWTGRDVLLLLKPVRVEGMPDRCDSDGNRLYPVFANEETGIRMLVYCRSSAGLHLICEADLFNRLTGLDVQASFADLTSNWYDWYGW